MVYEWKRIALATLGYPGLLGLMLECHVQQPYPYDVIVRILIDKKGSISYSKLSCI